MNENKTPAVGQRESDIPDIRILICDPKHKFRKVFKPIVKERLGVDTLPSTVLDTKQRLLSAIFGTPIGITYARSLDDIAQQLSLLKHSSAMVPVYSLIVYDAEQITNDGAAGLIARIRAQDYFLPQMVVGELSPSLAGRCARAGVLYFANSEDEMKADIAKIFRQPMVIPGLTLVKIGGSAFDFDRDNPSARNLRTVCRVLSKIHQERDHYVPIIRNERTVEKKQRRVSRMIVTAGAGQYGNVAKDWARKYVGDIRVEREFPRRIAEALQANLHQIYPLFDHSNDDYGKPTMITTGAFYFIDEKSTAKQIPLIGTAPHYVMVRDCIPLEDSDTHTIALAEFYGAKRVVLLKRTDGIYDFDPYRGFTLNPETLKCADLHAWLEKQGHNSRHASVSARQLLDDRLISRIGTGIDGRADDSSGHLMEDSSLEYMLRHGNHVEEIVLVHVAPEEIHYPIGGDVYRHVVTGEKITVPDHNWPAVLEQNIRDAFQGKAPSKIVRDAPGPSS